MFFDAECLVCDRPMGHPETRPETAGICPDCRAALGPAPLLAPPDHLDKCRALTAYAGTGRALVGRLKFHRRHGLAADCAELLVPVVAGDRIEVVTWAPTAPARRRRRGYDQAEHLARALARRLGLPLRACLYRLPGPAQTGRDRTDRLAGPRFDVHRGVEGVIGGRRVGLVDDVVTTGATLGHAARVLRAYGATEVVGVVVARTP